MRERNDAELQTIYGNLGQALWNTGDFAAAESAYGRAEEIARATYGVNHRDYWVPATNHARMVHLIGQRERAMQMFAALLALLPPESARYQTRRRCGSGMRAAWPRKGAANSPFPCLVSTQAHYIETPLYDYELRRLRMTLGDAYDHAGHAEDARKALKLSLDERVAKDPPDAQATLAIRERWGRFLLEHGDASGAEAQFREVLGQAHNRKFAHEALALGGMARLAMAKGDAASAREAARQAVELFAHVEGFRDVRMGPYLWLVYAQALLLAGDASAAHEWAQQALDADLRFDAPESPDIARARDTLLATTRATEVANRAR